MTELTKLLRSIATRFIVAMIVGVLAFVVAFPGGWIATSDLGGGLLVGCLGGGLMFVVTLVFGPNSGLEGLGGLSSSGFSW